MEETVMVADKGSARSKAVELASRLMGGVGRTARFGVKVLGFLLVVGILGYLSVMGYFWQGMGAGWKLMLLPGLLMGMPLFGVGGFLYVLYCLSNLPESMKEGVVGLLSIKGRHRERLEKLNNQKTFFPAFKRLRLTCGVLWDVIWNAQNHGETYGDAQMALWMLTPWFWMVAGVSGLIMGITQLGFGIFCLMHWLL